MPTGSKKIEVGTIGDDTMIKLIKNLKLDTILKKYGGKVTTGIVALSIFLYTVWGDFNIMKVDIADVKEMLVTIQEDFEDERDRTRERLIVLETQNSDIKEVKQLMLQLSAGLK